MTEISRSGARAANQLRPVRITRGGDISACCSSTPGTLGDCAISRTTSRDSPRRRATRSAKSSCSCDSAAGLCSATSPSSVSLHTEPADDSTYDCCCRVTHSAPCASSVAVAASERKSSGTASPKTNTAGTLVIWWRAFPKTDTTSSQSRKAWALAHCTILRRQRRLTRKPQRGPD